MKLSRRDFLKLSGAALLSMAFRHWPEEDEFPPPPTPLWLGRAVRALKYYEQPTYKSKAPGTYRADTILNIYEEKMGDARTSHNRLWYRTADGWIHSAYVQPVRNAWNRPILEIPETGLLAEVTVPFTDALRAIGGGAAYRFYYGTTHWVYEAVQDQQGQLWYRVLDDRYRKFYFVEAKHLRPVKDAELSPIAPEVADKRIEVDLTQQKLFAYENGELVFTAPVATGHKGWETPTGNFRIERKRPSRHMAAGDLAAGVGFDLPGVPWVAYFHWSGVAFHGTYWHNDYGTPKSAGCVNMKPDDARWLYRWTMPVVPAGVDVAQDDNGTEVAVVGETPDD